MTEKIQMPASLTQQLGSRESQELVRFLHASFEATFVPFLVVKKIIEISDHEILRGLMDYLEENLAAEKADENVETSTFVRPKGRAIERILTDCGARDARWLRQVLLAVEKTTIYPCLKKILEHIESQGFPWGIEVFAAP